MSRVLFVVPPLAGHTLPTVALGHELAGRGHEVAWVGHREVIAPLLPDPDRLIPVQRGPDDWLTEVVARSHGLRGPAAFQFLWRDFLIPLAESSLPGVAEAVGRFGPDLLVVDQQALAGGVVARQHGLPWVTSATTSAELTDPFVTVPKFGAWVREQLDGLQRAHRVPLAVAERGDLRFSEYLVLAYTTRCLVGSQREFPDHYAFVGPSLGARAATVDYPWHWLDGRRQHLLVTLGTVDRENGARFLNAVLAAVEPLGSRLQVTIAAPPKLFGELPAHVLVREFVPQLEVLARTDAVVCHGGHNTVCESLAHGLPLVVAPIRDDQPTIANQVVEAGAGRRVRFGRVGPAELRESILDVLTFPGYRAAAERIRASFADAGGTAAAADQVEMLT
ncbi:glycosyltransferase [Crossiella cryophila]|uniref:MGT family glycosyltransferase n=1 Tax=Crossiella cryophila TaxID=43355 RepID=A0A7W7C6U7_9PSEU|nr:nucleotide disphospho-sugar-binding domain-containing protein [Crossiella cryophila]MBB4675542.1 MGT family glycosyltransferase [Crossiella cryophila]